MAWTNNKRTVLWGTAVLVALVAATVFGLRHKIAHQMALTGGRRAIANHIAALVDMTASYTTPASYFDKITQFPAWKTVPRGFQTFDHVPLQIGGMICLWGGGNAKMGLIFPNRFRALK
jgi:hypothetical protein